MFRKILLFKFVPESKDLAMLALRLIAVTSIFLKHGLEKLRDYPGMLQTITARHHYLVMLGPGLTFFWETFSDGILSLLLVLGFATRWCALLSFCTLFTAWSAVLTFAYFDHGAADVVPPMHGEMIIAYLASLVALVLGGGGRYSIDAMLDRGTPSPNTKN